MKKILTSQVTYMVLSIVISIIAVSGILGQDTRDALAESCYTDAKTGKEVCEIVKVAATASNVTSCQCDGESPNFQDKYCGKTGKTDYQLIDGECWFVEEHMNAVTPDGGVTCTEDHRYGVKVNTVDMSYCKDDSPPPEEGLACENPKNDGENCSTAGDESTCWSRAGSGCWWNNGTCQCGGNPDDGNTCEVTGSGSGTSCSITVSNCGEGQSANLSVAKCRNSYDSLDEYNQGTNNGTQCMVGCGSSTQSFGNGTHTIDMTAPSCGRWQLDVVYNGRTICADSGCNDTGCKEPPPTDNPAIKVEKFAPAHPKGRKGEDIGWAPEEVMEYKIKVTNTGDVDLEKVTVVDDFMGFDNAGTDGRYSALMQVVKNHVRVDNGNVNLSCSYNDKQNKNDPATYGNYVVSCNLDNFILKASKSVTLIVPAKALVDGARRYDADSGFGYRSGMLWNMADAKGKSVISNKVVEDKSANIDVWTRFPNLKIKKSHVGDIFGPGEVVVYTLKYINTGKENNPDIGDYPVKAINTVITETIPSNMTPVLDYNGVTNGWSCNSTTCRLDVGTLLPDEPDPVSWGTVKIAFRVRSDLPSDIHSIDNRACVYPYGGREVDEWMSNNCDSDRIEIGPKLEPELRIDKSTNETYVNPGDVFDFYITVANDGNGPADNLIMSDVIPRELSYGSIESMDDGNWSCNYNPIRKIVTCDGDTLKAGARARFKLSVKVREDVDFEQDQKIVNTACVLDTDIGEESKLCDDASVKVQVKHPELEIVKDVVAVPREVGGSIVYGIKYRNTGEVKLTDTKIIDYVPTGTSFDARNSSDGWVCEKIAEGGKCVFDVGDLAPSTRFATLRFAVKPISYYGDKCYLNNVKIVGYYMGNEYSDKDDANACMNMVLDLSLNKDNRINDSLEIGQRFKYYLTVRNEGNVFADSVRIEDHIADYLDVVGAPNYCSYDNTTRSFTCDDDRGLGVRQSRTYWVEVIVRRSTERGFVYNKACVYHPDDSNPANNCDIDRDPILRNEYVDFETEKDNHLEEVQLGQEFDYYIAGYNIGNITSEEFVLRDRIPDYLEYKSMELGEGSHEADCGYNATTGIVTCLGTGLESNPDKNENGPRVLLKIKVKVLGADNNGDVINMACIESDQDNNPSNDCDDDKDRYVSPSPDLRVEKKDNVDFVNPGDGIIYTIRVYNDGDIEATGVKLIETLPKYTTFDAKNSDPDWKCAGVICTYYYDSPLQVNQSFRVKFAVIVSKDIKGVEYVTNAVLVTDDGKHGPDPTPENNRDVVSTPVRYPEVKGEETETPTLTPTGFSQVLPIIFALTLLVTTSLMMIMGRLGADKKRLPVVAIAKSEEYTEP